MAVLVAIALAIAAAIAASPRPPSAPDHPQPHYYGQAEGAVDFQSYMAYLYDRYTVDPCWDLDLPC